jgi:hypothetical protein
LQEPPKVTQIWIFGLKTNHLATLALGANFTPGGKLTLLKTDLSLLNQIPLAPFSKSIFITSTQFNRHVIKHFEASLSHKCQRWLLPKQLRPNFPPHHARFSGKRQTGFLLAIKSSQQLVSVAQCFQIIRRRADSIKVAPICNLYFFSNLFYNFTNCTCYGF